MSSEQFTVTDRAEASRIVLLDNEAGGAEVGQLEYVDVTQGDTTARVIYGTVISEGYEGRGLASQLAEHAVQETVNAGYRLVPVCPYVKKWLMKRPEFADHVDAPRPVHLEAIPRQTAS